MEPSDHRTSTAMLSTGVRLHYYEAGEGDDVLVLLHGFPNTAWQWRHVLAPLAAAGYRVIAPDYRGAGRSSRPRSDDGVPVDPRGEGLPRGGYDKWSMAEDVHELLHTHLGLTRPAFVLGHDVGAMLAVAYAFRYRADTRALAFGEAPVPGTSTYEQLKGDVRMFHFNFHAVLDLPEALVAGREREYVQHFYDKLGVKPHLVDTDHYAAEFAQPGAMRAGFDLYRAFERDARDTTTALERGGKLGMPVLAMTGAQGPFVDFVEGMARELADDVSVAHVPGAAHWIAEEDPEGCVAAITGFDGR